MPLDLISVFEKREIRETPNTKNFDEAKTRPNERAIHWDARFAEARKRLAQDGAADPVMLLSPEWAVKLVQAYVERNDPARCHRGLLATLVLGKVDDGAWGHPD